MAMISTDITFASAVIREKYVDASPYIYGGAEDVVGKDTDAAPHKMKESNFSYPILASKRRKVSFREKTTTL